MNLHKTLKKIYKAGYFHSFELTKNYLSFKDCYNNLYVLQPFKNFFQLSIGHIEQWKEFKPTYESEYNNLGWVNVAAFVNHIKPVITNNPDYVLRCSIENLFPTI